MQTLIITLVIIAIVIVIIRSARVKTNKNEKGVGGHDRESPIQPRNPFKN